jgi:steroid 5-alpha reductase family enzyme
MKTTDRNALIAFPILIIIGILVALAGSQGGSTVFGVPLFALSVGLAFLIQWLVFIPAYLLQTEKFFDLTGSITYISVTAIALILNAGADGRSILLAALVIIWAIRLGSFLFGRIRKAGKDDRFDEIKPSFIRFLNVWTIQGLWVTFTMAAALVAITTTNRKELDIFALAGFLIWAFGFAIEVIADSQKSRFSANPDNKGKFIQTGLWVSLPPSQLLWRNRSVGRRRYHCFARSTRLAMGRADFSALCHIASDPRQRSSPT